MVSAGGGVLVDAVLVFLINPGDEVRRCTCFSGSFQHLQRRINESHIECGLAAVAGYFEHVVIVWVDQSLLDGFSAFPDVRNVVRQLCAGFHSDHPRESFSIVACSHFWYG